MKKIGLVMMMWGAVVLANVPALGSGNMEKTYALAVDSADVPARKLGKKADGDGMKNVLRTVRFSNMEVNHIRVRTPGLFEGTLRFLVHLDSLDEERYCFPLPGAKVISAYGARRGHSGTDLKTKANDTIRCVFDGVVRMSKSYAAYGNVVVVRHDNGLESVYSHNSKNLVKSGDFVRAGQPIGLIGRTGRATTEHLHFEFRVNGQPFNPDIVFNLQDGVLRRETLICSKMKNGIVVKTFMNTLK